MPADSFARTVANGAALVAQSAAAMLPNNITFNTDGSITSVSNGQSSTVTFNTDGSITTVFGAPLSRTITTTFTSTGINEVQS
jgi:hypothetical protein